MQIVLVVTDNNMKEIFRIWRSNEALQVCRKARNFTIIGTMNKSDLSEYLAHQEGLTLCLYLETEHETIAIERNRTDTLGDIEIDMPSDTPIWILREHLYRSNVQICSTFLAALEMTHVDMIEM